MTNRADEAFYGNSQIAKHQTPGFRTVEYFIAMNYLIASDLDFDLPNPVPVTHTNSYRAF